MPNYWILKTEPSTYSFDHLVAAGTAVWDGVRNNLALKHIRAMRPGDRALIYHSGDEKAVVGVAKITSAPYADPKANDPKLAVIDIEAAGRLAHPVPLAVIKAEAGFRDLGLVRMGRLSVMPASAEQYRQLVTLGGQARD